MSTKRNEVLTIGHSNHELGVFLSMLKKHGVGAIADVRSSPYSRFNPQFNREPLEKSLASRGIRYVFLGRELGARSEDRSCYEKGRVQYGRLAQTQLFRDGLERVVRGAERYTIALMCAEKEPLDCHRTLLVARALASRGVIIQHILPDGRLEHHDATMERLFDVVRLPRQMLFRSKEELLAEALTRQEERIAFVDPQLISDAQDETE